MQKQSNNVVFGQNLAVLTAAAELGAEVIARSLGSESAANTLEGENVTMADIKSALVARIIKYLNR
jgi:hypothetical protein